MPCDAPVTTTTFCDVLMVNLEISGFGSITIRASDADIWRIVGSSSSGLNTRHGQTLFPGENKSGGFVRSGRKGNPPLCDQCALCQIACTPGPHRAKTCPPADVLNPLRRYPDSSSLSKTACRLRKPPARSRRG